MTTPGRLLLAGTLAFILALPPYLPAGFVFKLLAEHVSPGITWREVSGTVLEPRLYRVSAAIPGASLVIDEVAAKVRLLPLLIGRPALQFELRIADDRISGTGSFGAARWRIDKMDGTLQVASIVSRIPGAELAFSSGQIELTGAEWSGRYDSFPDSGTMLIRIKRLQSDLAGASPLGDYDINVYPARQGLNGEISTPDAGAPLNISATLSVDPALRQLNVQGTAEASPGAAESVRGLLPFFGTVDNNKAVIRFVTSY